MIHTNLYFLIHCGTPAFWMFHCIFIYYFIGPPRASLFSLSHAVTCYPGFQAPVTPSSSWNDTQPSFLFQINGGFRAGSEEQFVHCMSNICISYFSIPCPLRTTKMVEQITVGWNFPELWEGGRNNLKKESSAIGRWYTGYWDQRRK